MFRNKRLKTRSLSQSVRLKKDKNIAVAVGYAPPNRSATTARPSILSSSHSCTGATWSSSTFKESEYTGWISTFTLYRSLLRGEGGKVCHAHTHTHNTKTASTEARSETVVMLLWVKNKTRHQAYQSDMNQKGPSLKKALLTNTPPSGGTEALPLLGFLSVVCTDPQS
ncbi:hypothetical protein FQA47_014550 [Oryzias melastigma]|uniref:Uncharacterized protein n=1 Tax=Oryzias melastigma TaxID=30732 RepID=A0A834FKQ6_ORYME|nr:hypothetical protein FQA47_014550 [Oryzias melastigma]